VLVGSGMLLLGKTQKKHVGDLPPTTPDLPPPPEEMPICEFAHLKNQISISGSSHKQ